MSNKFRDRTQAGQILAQEVQQYIHKANINHQNILVLALPRGGVPVAFPVAKTLDVPLDICIVRKLGVPGHKELAMGAIAAHGVIILNHDVIETLAISQETIDLVAAEELQELSRRDHAYRGDKPPINVHQKTVILIDDGIATGSTIRAAITILKQQQPDKIIIATPIAPPDVCQQLQLEVDDVICLQTPEPMSAIGLWYDDFTQTTDDQVRELLTGSW
ncbi:phosphoribosyltransferase [Anabaena sp. FACHB-1237]|uniref:phosphoribosyltransferase n=1 Tax=Anabaena sp. FACHB-1237 TaxID=2692769 RepID=UPI0016801171|nr:phosphoribosyltransferase [Anabaena sp. FACHB-1237]MBD2137189.1 phosphoribosyltransferase [Anabaena sp. FACHB-1237]